MLTPRALEVLRWLAAEPSDNDVYDREIVCDGCLCYLGEEPTSVRLVNTLLCHMAVSESIGGGGHYYVINETGRAILKNPALADELTAMVIANRPFTIIDGRIVPYADKIGES